MKCPTCGAGDHRVMRTDAKDGVLRRARECLACGKRWHTIEAPEREYQDLREVREIVRELGQKVRDAVGE